MQYPSWTSRSGRAGLVCGDGPRPRQSVGDSEAYSDRTVVSETGSTTMSIYGVIAQQRRPSSLQGETALARAWILVARGDYERSDP